MNFKAKFDKKTQEKLLRSMWNIEYYILEDYREHFANIEFISSVSRFYMYFEDDKYEKRIKCNFAIFNPIKEQSDDDDWLDTRDYIRFSLDVNYMPYLKNAYCYNLFLASNRSLLEKATISYNGVLRALKITRQTTRMKLAHIK